MAMSGTKCGRDEKGKRVTISYKIGKISVRNSRIVTGHLLGSVGGDCQKKIILIYCLWCVCVNIYNNIICNNVFLRILLLPYKETEIVFK
jgi:hypothetical protein